jgi:hypothetical protein
MGLCLASADLVSIRACLAPLGTPVYGSCLGTGPSLRHGSLLGGSPHFIWLWLASLGLVRTSTRSLRSTGSFTPEERVLQAAAQACKTSFTFSL